MYDKITRFIGPDTPLGSICYTIFSALMWFAMMVFYWGVKSSGPIPKQAETDAKTFFAGYAIMAGICLVFGIYMMFQTIVFKKSYRPAYMRY